MTDTKHVLVIEDEVSLSNVIASTLQEAGHDVSTAGTAQEGLDMIRSRRPQIIFLDILLPQHNGFLFLELVQDDAELSTIPVVILSNLNQPDNIAKGKKLGAVDYLVKTNISIDTLAGAVERYAA